MDRPTTIGSPEQTLGAGGATEVTSGDRVGAPATAELREYLSFVRRRTVPDNMAQPVIADILVYDFKDDVEINLTGGRGDVDCVSRLCVVSPALTWVAWLDPDQNQLKVAPIDLDSEAVLTEQTRVVEANVDRVEFMTYTSTDGEPIELLVYTLAQSGSREIIVEPVAGYACVNGGPACRTSVATINSAGAFRVSEKGDVVVIIDISLGTMDLIMYNLGSGRQQTIYRFGDNNSAGTQWSGRLPIALSPDGQFLMVATNNDKLWRLNKISVGANPELTVQELFEIRNEVDADGKPKACMRGDDASYWEVMLNPIFTSNSEWIYFLVHGDCTGGSRDDYDIMRIKSDLSGDWQNITKTKREFYAAHHQINYFDLSADGSKIVFVSEKPNRAASDSIWIVDAETGHYDCSRADAPAGQRTIDGKDYCEFISFDGTGGPVNHQDVRFHVR